MANEDFEAKQNDIDFETDALDLALDAALARYTAVEPRAGLEERVLANLRAEQRHLPVRSCWQWTALATAAMLFLAGMTLLWRSQAGSPHNVARSFSPTAATQAIGGRDVVADRGTRQPRLPRPTVRRATPKRTPNSKNSVPKLDQFPSPRPLSEQEKVLTSYMNEYPQHAALIAQARFEALRQDLAEELKDAAVTQDSQQ